MSNLDSNDYARYYVLFNDRLCMFDIVIGHVNMNFLSLVVEK